MNVRTEAELAEHLKIPVAKVVKLRQQRHWPHLRLGRFDVRYTDAQVEQIEQMQTVAPKPVSAGPTKVQGQTARSAARRRSA